MYMYGKRIRLLASALSISNDGSAWTCCLVIPGLIVYQWGLFCDWGAHHQNAVLVHEGFRAWSFRNAGLFCDYVGFRPQRW